MKKTLLIIAIISTNAVAQINLKDDSVTFKNERPTNGVLSSENFDKLNGFSKYSGTIQGFSAYCKYPVESQKIFYDNFFKKISNLNLKKEEIEIITNSFKQSAYEIRKNGIADLSCDKFKVEFEKIIKEIN